MHSMKQACSGWQPVERPQRPVLFVNPLSGGGKATRAAVADRARERGVEAIVLAQDQSLAALIRDAVARGADALGVAGGDGSLAIVAETAQAHSLPFVCIPTGTRNHFARDLGVDLDDPVGALDAFTEGVERRIDLGEVNGHVFLNNVSLGIYGNAVRRRGYRGAKVRTILDTTAEVLGPGAPVQELQLADDLGREHRHPAVVLVSNNPYALDRPLVPGTRSTLDSGRLGIIVLETLRWRPDPPPRSWSATAVQVTAPAPVHAGVDGEAVDLMPPLEFLARPAALRVRISRRHPGTPHGTV